jgi:hypothetical protein
MYGRSGRERVADFDAVVVLASVEILGMQAYGPGTGVDNGSRDAYAGAGTRAVRDHGDGSGADGSPWMGRNMSFLCIKA